MSNQADLALAYSTYRPLLLGALGRLATRGYPVPPDEGLGLIHDFFLDVWPTLRNRHDPDRGSLSTYVFGSFVNFARPRIVRMRRWQAQLADDEPVYPPSSQASPDSALDIEKVHRALAELPFEDRQLLMDRFGTGMSERHLAKGAGRSRYRVREQLIQALAKLITLLDDRELLPARDRALARLLWVDALPLAEAARQLHLTPAQARAARTRVLSSVNWVMQRQAEDPRETPMTDLCNLWRQFVMHPEDGTIREHVARVRERLVDHIDDCPACGETLPPNAELLSAIYRVLGAIDDSTDGEDDLLQLHAELENDVREAVTSILYPALPDSVRRGVEGTFDPVVVFQAIDAIAMLIDRHWTDENTRRPLTLTPEGLFELAHGTPPRKLAERAALVTEIGIMSKLDTRPAERLLHWALAAARTFTMNHPEGHFFPGVTMSVSRSGDLEVRGVSRAPQLDLATEWAPGNGQSAPVLTAAAAAATFSR